jgi:DNA (cytosine-5)-methyltransferase 1
MNELSLFSGYGGFSLGLRLAGINVRTVAYVEWEKYPQEIIKARIRDGFLDDAPIFSDISAFRGEQFRGLVDIITAGFPCQPHSVAGLKQGADDERNLWPDTLRVIREVEPRWVLLENVPGLLSASADGGTPAYGGTVVGELASIGFSVHWQTIGADDVGAPHRRKRWWCIAVANAELADPKRRGCIESGVIGGMEPVHGTTSNNPSTSQESDPLSTSTDTELADPDGSDTGRQDWYDSHGSWSRGQASRPRLDKRDAELADPTSDGLCPSESGVIREDYGPSTPREDAAEAGRRSSSGCMADASSERGSGGKIHRGYERETPQGRETSTSQPSSQDGELVDADGNGTERNQPQHWDGGRVKHRVEELDDAEHDGQPSPQEPRGTGPRVHPQGGAQQPEQPAGPSGGATGGEELANTTGTRLERPEHRVPRDAAESGSELGDSNGNGTERNQPQHWAGGRAEYGIEELADCKSEGLEGVKPWAATKVQFGLRSGAIPTWPPGPGDTDGWAELLAERPDLVPALDKEAESQFRGVDDGRSHRVDELKALGNGIVPAVVAEFLRRVM